MSQPIDYRRLPGRASLYLGPDHVLTVRSSGYVQQYRRFYLHDIQAIVLAGRGSSWTYFLYASSVFLIVICLALVYWRHPISAILCGSASVLAFLLGIRMPNCACYLKTATTTERLPSLGRISSARKALAILQPLIAEAQSNGHA